MISGSTTLIAHIGYPTETFKAPLIYNPYFEKARIDAVVVPMGVKAGDYRDFLKSIFRLTNIRGALITMPHKGDYRRIARRVQHRRQGGWVLQRYPAKS
jgi:shikimate dehydrogenase